MATTANLYKMTGCLARYKKTSPFFFFSPWIIHVDCLFYLESLNGVLYYALRVIFNFLFDTFFGPVAFLFMVSVLCFRFGRFLELCIDLVISKRLIILMFFGDFSQRRVIDLIIYVDNNVAKEL